ncbi:hypothetical protein F2Q70_00019002 [Brassica cretica]|uniref:Phorbol-ester/DAG-type domain-containing protein n=1 Tax=Brassica cretica TaxID=69181 RepID=A0A8S9HLV9_BRACR|nr:hypothetical protein F2Q70_00019002 [Brassica cretica]
MNLQVCLQCDFVVHKNCIYLPFVIRISRHDHRLSFTYSLPRILSCGVCRQNVDGNYGNYSCTKDCSYAVHSKCATREDVWDGKELEEKPEEDYENLNSFEVIGDGIIQHFSHSHHMKFERKTTDIMYDDEKRCQACLLPFYGGNELGKYRPCSICKKEKVQTLNCIECSFFLCFYCATLPYKVRYEHDEHFLTLSYKENESLNWCEICEEIMDSTIWLYTCHECGTVFHIQCLLRKCAPYVKPAQNLLLDDEKINIIPNNRLTRPICNGCGRRCQDKLILEFYEDDRKMLYCWLF